jgi:hypothetical protein
MKFKILDKTTLKELNTLLHYIYAIDINGDIIKCSTDSNDNPYTYLDNSIVLYNTFAKDKNNNDLFVGDILKYIKLDGSVCLYKIFEVFGGYAINTHQDDFYKDNVIFYTSLSDMQTISFIEGNCERIGNIYQNVELLIK